MPPGTRRAAPDTLALPRRRPIRDNPRLLLAGIVLLVGALGGLLALASRSTSYAPDFPDGGRALRPVGGRSHDAGRPRVRAGAHIVKLLVERRRALRSRDSARSWSLCCWG
jgi:hypothetical protein